MIGQRSTKSDWVNIQTVQISLEKVALKDEDSRKCSGLKKGFPCIQNNLGLASIVLFWIVSALKIHIYVLLALIYNTDTFRNTQCYRFFYIAMNPCSIIQLISLPDSGVKLNKHKPFYPATQRWHTERNLSSGVIYNCFTSALVHLPQQVSVNTPGPGSRLTDAACCPACLALCFTH